jgi:hypothetical protein
VRRGRKATGLNEIAGLPERGRLGFFYGLRAFNRSGLNPHCERWPGIDNFTQKMEVVMKKSSPVLALVFALFLALPALATTYTYTPIKYPGVFTYNYATGINDSGAIVGYYGWPEDESGFLKVGDTYTSFNYPDAIYTQPYSINNSGQIVGFYQDPLTFARHGFLKVGDTYTTIGLADVYAFNGAHGISINYPGADITVATGINDSGDIVGWYGDASGHHGFLKVGGTYTSFDYPGDSIMYPYAINNSGDIVGMVIVNAGYPFGFLATPVPLPSTLLLLGSGLLGLAGCRRFRKG